MSRDSLVLDSLVSAAITLLIMGVAVVSSSAYHHWFIIPVALSGLLIGVDAVAWARGRVDLFDPAGVVGAFGYFFFFLAPLLHVHWDYWMLYQEDLSNWRHWSGMLAALNVLGIAFYQVVRRWRIERFVPDGAATSWRIDNRRFWVVLAALLVGTAALQGWVYYDFGGIDGYIEAYAEGPEAFAGKGIIFAVAESFPILAMFGYAWYARASRTQRRWIEIGAVLALFVVLKLLFGGLRGSRSATVWGLFWAVGLIHLWVRPLSRRLVLAGLIPLFLFMLSYGFYKSYGTDLGAVVSSPDEISAVLMDTESGRSIPSTLLRDFGRFDAQAYLIYRTTSDEVQEPYSYAHGRTYLGAAALAIPGRVWPDRPPTKVRETTNALYGDGTFEEGELVSSRVFGIAGEAILNFNHYAMPFAYLAVGMFVGLVQRARQRWSALDGRLLLYPMLVNLAIVIIISDSDNVVMFLVRNLMVPGAFLLAVCTIQWRSSDRQPAEASGSL